MDRTRERDDAMETRHPVAGAGRPRSAGAGAGRARSAGAGAGRARPAEWWGRRRRGVVGRLAGVGRDEQGSATAEYAIVILAAVAFAGVLVAVMRSGAIASILTGLVTDALTS